MNAILTAVELETLSLLADGLNAPEIAVKLYMSLGAINSRVTRIRCKLGARTQAHAVALAYQHGIISVPNSAYIPAEQALIAALRQAGLRITGATEEATA